VADDPKKPAGAPDKPAKDGGTQSPLLQRLQQLNANRGQTSKTMMGMPVVQPPAPPTPQPAPPAAPPPSPSNPSSNLAVGDTTAQSRLPSPRPRNATVTQGVVPPPPAQARPSPPPPAPIGGASSAAKPLSMEEETTSVEPAPLAPPPDLVAAPALPLASPPSGAMSDKDSQITMPRTLVEPTPAPLPPAPRAADAEVWFEEAPTRPAALSDMAPPPPAKPKGGLPGAPEPRAATGTDAWYEQQRAQSSAEYSDRRRTILIPALASAISLVVGILLGALIFGGGGGGGGGEDEKKTASVADNAVAPVCPPSEGGADAGAGAIASSAGAPDAGEKIAEAPEAAPDAGAAVGPPEDPGGIRLASGGECALAITSSPSGAEVTVAGEAVGATPKRRKQTLDVGGVPCDEKVVVTAAKDPYEDYRKEVVASPGKPLKVAIALKPPKVKLEVTSTPPGAAVTVNGKAAGKTPTTASVPAFSRAKVSVSLSGYKPYESTVTPKSTKTVKVAATLEKEKKFKVPPKKK
jgi:hypothetical protein